MTPLDASISSTTENLSYKLSADEVLEHCNHYKGSNALYSTMQFVTTFVLFIASYGLCLWAVEYSYFFYLCLALPAAGLLTRLFIIQHDCGHGSYFNTKNANDYLGSFLSLFTFTPYDFWRRAHNKHHATSGNLDKRSIGGIDTISIDEYKNLPAIKKVLYRVYRNPFILFIFGTPIYVIIMQRLPIKQATIFHDEYVSLDPKSIRKSVMTTNLSLLLLYGTLGAFIGFQTVLITYLPIVILTSQIGGALFYIQHQFEETYWEHNKDWTFKEAALYGSSYYELPKILQWFTGNIGFHHIHHLCSKIPNYKLQDCMDGMPELYNINRITLSDFVRCTKLSLWDEDNKRLVTLNEI